MKLFEVEVIYRTVILAESAEQAEQRAPFVIRSESDDEPESVYASEIKKLEQLSAPWDGSCRPWGERDPLDRTIKQILDDSKK